jgi:hypothetical protein
MMPSKAAMNLAKIAHTREWELDSDFSDDYVIKQMAKAIDEAVLNDVYNVEDDETMTPDFYLAHQIVIDLLEGSDE